LNSSDSNIAIVILAAGESKRLGSPKQLLPWKETILINHIIDNTVSTKQGEVFLVLGAYREQIQPKINASVTILINENWRSGMGTSINTAIDYLKDIDNIQGVLFLLVDQPLVSTEDISLLVETFKNNSAKIIVSQYPDGRLGVPAIFSSIYFEELNEFKEDMGARKLINSNYKEVLSVKLNHRLVDIDTEEEYKKLYREYH
jgi:molybdenum cofactor cytidylyltransferase